ncbi:MAG TPA: hypothetical protein VKA78_00110 [Pyrinomonadaceae bacterium]|nr:hypothetical protein [Pyrinomonadaceae bacterium]
MHNCRETKEQITELLLDGADRRPDEGWCSECRAEFDTLNATLRVTTRLRETATAAESYWSGYHVRLREKLSRAKAQRRKEEPRFAFAPLRLCVRTTVRVPVPLVIAVILAFAALALVAIRAARETTNPNPIIVHVPVEVPVVREKIVARVVYRERRSRPRSSKQINDAAKVETTFAKSQKPQNIPASLTGFKPAEEIKFTVIKGGSPNEK